MYFVDFTKNIDYITMEYNYGISLWYITMEIAIDTDI